MKADKYCAKSERFTYESYVFIFENNMRILSRNNEEMRDAWSIQNLLLGIKCSWFAPGKAFVTGSYAHKNDFAKTTAYLASFVQHSKGGGRKISEFYAQGSGGGRHRGCFGRGIHGRGGCNVIGGQVVRRDIGVSGAKPDINFRSYTDQEWALLSFNEKWKLFALCNKAEPRKINAVKISEVSIAKIATIAAR